jgi:hypothetical protein
MSAVTAAVTSASSAYVRDAYTWPTRASSSSSVSRPFHERGLEGANHPLAVGVRRAEVAMLSAFRTCRLISRP